jgi:hypothetical protein
MGEAPAALAVDDAPAQRTVARSGGPTAARAREGARRRARRTTTTATSDAIRANTSMRDASLGCVPE